MQDQISQFLDAMREAGCAPVSGVEIVADDVLRRFQVDGDKPKTENGAYQLRIDPDGFAVGWFKTWKDGVTHSWHSKTSRKASADEKAEAKKRIEDMKQARAKAEADAHRLAAEKAERLWAEAKPATGDEDYLKRKQITGEGCRVMGDAIVVPMRKDGRLTGLQFIQPDGSKRFLYGSDVDGSYHSLARKGDDLATIAICEGFATAASVRAAMGWPVIVAFNAGNLKPVAKSIRDKYPDARIVICADNDQWTVIRGKHHNTGRIEAQQAAVTIGGAQVVWPDVPEDDASCRTDWNDIHVSDGLDAVRHGLTAAPVVERPPSVESLDIPTSVESLGDDDYRAKDPLDIIRPMGHDRGEYVFFPKSGGQIVRVGATALGRIQTLYRLAPRGFWEAHYGNDGKSSDSEIASYASAHLIEACHHKGVFQADNVRGVGAWIDGGKVVVNCGDVILTEDEKCHPSDFKGKHVYEAGPRVIDLECDALETKAAAKLRDLCRMLSWKRPQFADLLAGWIVLASVGSALRWRPHIVLTGSKGCGKSTVMDGIIKPSLGDIALKRDGGTTEAGARKALGASGRPFIMDEAESETAQTRAEMAKIFFLARRSSSGSMVENANASFQVRSCFCFAAINPRIEQGADKDRITTLELIVDKSHDREAKYQSILRAIDDTITPGFAQKLMARTVRNMDALLYNIDVFSAEAAEVLGDKRSGDQVGPMIAGAYSLVSTAKVTREFARDWMRKQDWDWHSTDNDMSDAERLVTHIMTSRVRYDADGRNYESTIGEMVQRASDVDGVMSKEADKGLRGYGIRVIDGRVLIANNSPQLRRLLDDTPWGVWRRTLSDYPGADNYGNKPVSFGPAFVSKATSLPLDAVLGRVAAVEEEIGFGMEDFA